MSDLFDTLTKYDRDILISNSNGIVLNLSIHKTDDIFQIECVANNNMDIFIKIPILLFKINNRNLTIDQFEELLYDSLDSINKCDRCSCVYVGDQSLCCVCVLENKYIEKRPSKSFECCLCSHSFFKSFSKKINCCNKNDLRVCKICADRLQDHGFCAYCRNPVELV